MREVSHVCLLSHRRTAKQELHASYSHRLAWPLVQGVGWYRSGKALLTVGTVLSGYRGDGRDESSCQTSIYCQIRLLVRQRKLTSCLRGKPRLFTVTSHTAGKSLRRDKNHDSHSRRGSGRGLYANVDQSPLSGRGHVTPLDQ